MNFYLSKLNYCTKSVTNSKQLYKYLIKACKKLPSGPREHYVFSIKQSFKQHVNETDPERINQMISKSLNDADWILKKEVNKMFKVPLATSEDTFSKTQFWNSIFIYHSLPHVINRRILCVTQIFYLKVKFNHKLYTIKDVLKYSELYSQVYRLEKLESTNINTSIITNLFEQYKDCFRYEQVDFDQVKSSENDIFVSVRILFPRNTKVATSAEFVIIDKKNTVVSFIAISTKTKNVVSPNFQYDVELDRANLIKICVDVEAAENKECDWLADALFSKLITWAEDKNIQSSFPKSLSLIPEEKYCLLYHNLKDKYGYSIVKMWPENTDPLKFVYEDIAIATYLILLFARKSTMSQKFVDLGCGNGLLVHILSQEGHTGYGIDIRSRKIWSLYPKTTQLKVQTIVPSTEFLFPDADWLIGNHSDELSPWIPVMAAKSSEKCNYFLLPCCSYEFDGKKYQRVNTKISQYQDFVEYVKKISEVCGFETEVDKLRIPSTKRICLVGTERKCSFTDTNENIDNYISERIGQKFDSNNWVPNYVTRPAIEQVRNCTKLNKDLLTKIVKLIFNFLISKENYIPISLGKSWNAGSKIHLSEIVKIVAPDDLKQLKNECGGLQTLLRNHHYIFLVQNANVQLRIPQENANAKKRKINDCWFHVNHPDGCPLNDESCTFVHN